MERRTIRDLFGNPRALEPFLKDMSQTVTMNSQLPVVSNSEPKLEKIVIAIPDLLLWGMPDTPETRSQLTNTVNGAVQDLIQSKSIGALSGEGIKLEVQRNSSAVGYQLVVQVWHSPYAVRRP